MFQHLRPSARNISIETYRLASVCLPVAKDALYGQARNWKENSETMVDINKASECVNIERHSVCSLPRQQILHEPSIHTSYCALYFITTATSNACAPNKTAALALELADLE